jgi:phospholipase/carboxylesterase
MQGEQRMASLQDAGAGAHAGQHVHTTGAPLGNAASAMVMLHGRGGSAPDILGLAASLKAPGLAFLAPQAASNTWYPHRFLEPAAANEPHLSAALTTVGRVLEAVEAAGVPAERVILLGFSRAIRDATGGSPSCRAA